MHLPCGCIPHDICAPNTATDGPVLVRMPCGNTICAAQLFPSAVDVYQMV